MWATESRENWFQVVCHGSREKQTGPVTVRVGGWVLLPGNKS